MMEKSRNLPNKIPLRPQRCNPYRSAFNGGFLHCIAKGFDPFAAAEFANSVALFKAIKGGGIDSLPTAEDLKV
jgi:hypothetical protein